MLSIMADESESTTLQAVLEQVQNATTVAAAVDEDENEIDLEVLVANVDNFFLIVMGCIVFLMQCGFAFLEAGCVRYSSLKLTMTYQLIHNSFVGARPGRRTRLTS